MTYDPKIPNALQSPSNSVTDIQTNFDQYANIFSRLVGGVTYNHVAFNDTNQGKHAAVLIENRTTDPGVTEDQTVLYNKNAISRVTPAPGQPQLFAQIPEFLPTDRDTTRAANTGMQITYHQVNTAGPQYQSFLIGGYLLFTGTSPGNVTVTLTPTPSEILMVQFSTNNKVVLNVTQPDKFTTGISIATPLSWVVIARA